MSRYFRTTIALFAIAWSVLIVPVEGVKHRYASVTRALAEGREIDDANRENLIREFGTVSSLGICLPHFREQRAAFLLDRARSYPMAGETGRAVHDLREAERTLQAMLSCTPFEANQWLSFATVDAMLNGVRDTTFRAFNMSFLTAPRELWIVERRLGMALAFVGLLRKETRQIVHGDIRVLESAEIGERNKALRRLGVASLDDLRSKLRIPPA